MDLRDGPEDAAFRAELRAWLAANAPPRPYPQRGDEGWLEFSRAWQRRLYEGGFAGLSWPREYGGRGASLTQQLIFEEEVERAAAPGLFNEVGVYIAGPAIMAHGTHQQQGRHLPRILSGDEVWCQGFSEPGAGSDLAALRTSAVLEGGEWIVNGQKVWSTLAHVADWCEMLVRTEQDAPKHKGISCLLVDMRTPGIEVRPLRQITGRSDFNEVFFTDVRVPAANLLGSRGQGWAVAMTTLANERAGVLSSHVRTQARVGELARLMRERGRDGDAAYRQRLGACAVDAEILRLLAAHAATLAGRGQAPGHEAPMAKLLWSELEQRIHETAADLLGEQAAIAGPWLQGLLDSRSYTIAAGTSEIMRNMLAERALGLPREPR